MVLKIKKTFKIFHLWSLQIRTPNHWGILHVKLNSMPKGCQIARIGISSFALFPCTDQKPNKWMSLIKPFRLCYTLEDWNPYLCLYLFYSPSRDLRVSQCSPHCHSYLFICFTTLLSQEENNWSRFDPRSLGIWTQISMCGCHATAPYRFLDWFHCFSFKKTPKKKPLLPIGMFQWGKLGCFSCVALQCGIKILPVHFYLLLLFNFFFGIEPATT